MRINSFHIRNFRRLKDVHIDLDSETSIFVGANNSGKTSATQIFQLFLNSARDAFSIHDFSSDCWTCFNEIGLSNKVVEQNLPAISLDIWLDVDESDLHRVIKLLPNLEWTNAPVGVRLEFAPKNPAQLVENFYEANEKAIKLQALV